MKMSSLKILFTFVFMINGQLNTSGDNNVSGNNIIKRRTKEYLELCPYTDTCYTNVSKPDEIIFGMALPCCNPCRCDIDCGRNCCPDISVDFENEEKIYEAKEIHQCVDAQYRPYDTRISNGRSFEMISKCPYKYNDTEIAAKCAREYHAVSFDVPLRYILPVYDNLTDSIYQNIFCAICHKVELDSLVFGRISIECKVSTRNITYIRDLTVIPDLGDEDGCNVLFKIPEEKIDAMPWAMKTCDRTFIDRCNVTGQWQSYDSHLEEACLSYESVYSNFRNVHCLLCNSLNKSEVKRTCQYPDFYYDYTITERKMFNFITLLNWNTKEDVVLLGNTKQQTNLNEQCLQNSLLDPLRREDWLLQCPRGMVMTNRMCLPPHRFISSDLLMEINLFLEPYDVQKQDKLALNKMISVILDEIELKKSLLITRNVELQNMKCSLKFKTDLGGTNPKSKVIALESVQYVKVNIQILIYNAEEDLFGTVLDFALVFTNISSIGNVFKAYFHHFDNFFIEQRPLKSNCVNVPNLPLFQLCLENKIPKERMLYFEVLRKQETVYVNESYIEISLEQEPFCPRIALPKLTFMNCNESAIYTNNFLSTRLTENETHMFFCHEDFFQHLDSLHTNQVIVNQKVESGVNIRGGVTYLTIVCLSISLLSLVLTLTVYSVYPALRSLPGLNNMALVTSLIIFQAISLVSTVTNINISWLCSLFGAVHHFSLTLSFAWMFVCTFHMMKVFVKIRNRSVGRNDFRTFVSYIVFTTSVSLSTVSITIVVAAVQSEGEDIGYGGATCYIKDPANVLFLVALPVAIVVFANIFMFCVVVFKIHKHPTLSSSNPKERHNITIFAKLSTITGMTWIFGFIYIFTQVETFAYIFIILNAGQGVFIMLSFVCNRRVISLLCKTRFRRQLTKQTTSTGL
ncbi:uncharacterized protein LOC123545052 [Mercenaria mercenaria]|uniref:uncharacterized protein LOC123545052 n=1 Tax=Mercenaria mercenaria TaxID=6596 RepID=UPI00234EF18B|nr:uncharacterized protein LOC123545052 [Mercenaria mercenaria]